MFGPFDGVMEDPATGSANCALGALLAGYDATRDGTIRYRAAAATALALVALVAIVLPAVRTARVEIVSVLRLE